VRVVPAPGPVWGPPLPAPDVRRLTGACQGEIGAELRLLLACHQVEEVPSEVARGVDRGAAPADRRDAVLGVAGRGRRRSRTKRGEDEKREKDNSPVRRARRGYRPGRATR